MKRSRQKIADMWIDEDGGSSPLNDAVSNARGLKKRSHNDDGGGFIGGGMKRQLQVNDLAALAREAAPMFMGSTNGSAAQGGAGMGTVFDRELLAAYVLGADGGSEDGSEAEGLELDGGDWGLPQEAALGPLPAIDWLLKVVVQGATTRVPFPLQNAHRFHQACSCAENVCRFLLVSCPGPEDG